ncbi:S66 peptidase family protein [Paenibacillus yanchengensis]|uniref:S66 peptidase family protein n=1 Tax=Paenibacillus yanchengensis TaxID=2035833 RepID=A0ABW4YQQ6_9BACL
MNIKPKCLTKQARIAVVSPSNGLPYLFPEIYELGLNNLRALFEFNVVEMPTARMSSEQLYRNPQMRAEELNECFANPNIDGIITSIGGYESIRILPYLDTELILQHPKFIMGFSDATTFLCYLNTLGLVTFYGPSVMAGIAQLRNLPKKSLEQMKTILFSDKYPFPLQATSQWTNGYRDWSDLNTLGECLPFQENKHYPHWRFLQGTTTVQGKLWGGCIEVLEFMKGTDYWPSPDFWHDKILLFETSEEKPSPEQVGYMLRNYGMQGILHKVQAILFGRAKDYSSEENIALEKIILSIVEVEFGLNQLVIAFDVDFGHTDPKLILPLGTMVELDSAEGTILLQESPFQ